MIVLLTISDDDSTIVAEIYDSYSGELLHVAYKVLGSREGAEDALQTAFIRILGHMDTIRNLPCHKRLPYIVVVVRNQAINDYKKGKRQQGWSLDDLEPILSADCSVEQEVIQKTEVEKLRGHVKKLPDELRLPLLLRYGENLPYKKIGILLGITEALARKRVQRALEQLRRYDKKVVW